MIWRVYGEIEQFRLVLSIMNFLYQKFEKIFLSIIESKNSNFALICFAIDPNVMMDRIPGNVIRKYYS